MASRAGPDYGAVRRFGIGHVVIAVTVMTAAIAMITFNFVHDRGANMGVAKAWDIEGPPCPALTAAQFTGRRYTAKKTFDYDGVTIGRTAGHVSCSDVKDSGGKGLFNDKVCQFTSPATVTVTSSAGSFYFVPGPGQPASLVIHRNVPRCVMASKYTLQGGG